MHQQPAASGLRLYLATAFLARLAEEGMAVAVVMLALHRTGSAADGAFVLTAWMAPHVLAAPLVGAFATRMRRPRVFYLGALGGFAAAIAALAVIVGRVPTPVTLTVALAGGSCGPAVYGGLSSLLAGLVPEGAPRDRAYALDAAVYSAASVAGPAAVSIMAGLVSPGPAMAVLGGAAAIAAALATGLPYGAAGLPDGVAGRTGGAAEEAYGTRRGGPAPGTATLRADLMAGVTAVRRIRELRAITAATCLAYGGIGGLATTTVLLADHWGSPGNGGLLMTAFAIGTLVGSLTVARWKPPVTVQRLATIALFGTGLALAAAALVPATPVGAALFALAGLCEGPLLTATLRIRAEHAPPRARPQVFTLGAGLKISAAACGAALVGVAAALPPPLLLLGIAALQLAAGLLYMLTRSRRDRGTHSPRAPDRAPDTRRPAAP